MWWQAKILEGFYSIGGSSRQGLRGGRSGENHGESEGTCEYDRQAEVMRAHLSSRQRQGIVGSFKGNMGRPGDHPGTG